MQMINVVSSNIVAIGYKEKEKELYVNFKTGSYVYYDVPKKTYDTLMSAPSHGKYLCNYVKGCYAYARLK